MPAVPDTLRSGISSLCNAGSGLIGYKSRELAIKPEHFHHAYTDNGIFFPVIAHEGIICGKWSPWEKKN